MCACIHELTHEWAGLIQITIKKVQKGNLEKIEKIKKEEMAK